MLKSLAAFTLFSVSLFSMVSCSENPERTGRPKMIGLEPVPAVQVTNYKDVLSAWVRSGYRDMTVVHVGPQDGLAYIPDKGMKEIGDFLHNPSLPGAAYGDASRDFLFAAARLGIITRIYWIIPYGQLDYIDAEARIRSFLKNETSYFRTKDIETMRFDNGCISGTLFGVEMHICNPATLPYMSEPVLMTLDTRFFPAYAARKGLSNLRIIKDFFDMISSRRIRVQSVHVVDPSGVQAFRGYLSEELFTILKNPSVLRKKDPPGLWTVRDGSDNMFTGGGFKEAAAYLDRESVKYPGDPYLILLRETTHALLGKELSDLKAMAGQCTEKPMFCRGIVDAAVLLRDKGNTRAAEEFFRKVISLQPGLGIARLEYGRLLYKEGRFREALDILNGVSSPGYAVSARFLQGDCAYALREEDAALKYYERALEAYRSQGRYRPEAPWQKSLNVLRAILEKRGDQKGLETLRGTPSFE